MGRNLPPSQIIPAQPAFIGLRRWWRRMFPKPTDFTVRYFVAYDYFWKLYANGRPTQAMGHCVLEVAGGGINSWEKVCAIQGWVTQSVLTDSQVPILSAVRVSNFIAIDQFLTPEPNEHPKQQPVQN